MVKKEEEVIVVLKRTRKAFLLEYFCGFFLFGLLFFFSFKDIVLPKIINYSVLGFAFFSIATAEFSRFMVRYKITNTKLVVIEGILKQLKTNVYFHPLGFVPDINIEQSRLQRVLGFGTIFVKGGAGNSFELKDINRPHQIMGFIEELVEENKGTTVPTAVKRMRGTG